MWILDTIFAREILLVWMFCPQLTDTMSQILDGSARRIRASVHIARWHKCSNWMWPHIGVGGWLNSVDECVREKPKVLRRSPAPTVHFNPSVCQALKMGTPAREVSRWNSSGNLGGSLVQLPDEVQLDKFQINVILNRSPVSCQIKCVSFKDTKTITRSALTLIF